MLYYPSLRIKSIKEISLCISDTLMFRKVILCPILLIILQVSSISALLLQIAKTELVPNVFTSFFLISITLLPVALQNAQLKTYPLTTFVSDVFDPLSTDVMKDIQEHVVIKDQELTYTGTNPVHKTSKGQVILGQEAKASEGKELTLHFDRKQLIISKRIKNSLQSHTRLLIKKAFGIKSFTQAIS